MPSQVQFGIELEFLAEPNLQYLSSIHQKLPLLWRNEQMKQALDQIRSDCYHLLATSLNKTGLAAAFKRERWDGDSSFVLLPSGLEKTKPELEEIYSHWVFKAEYCLEDRDWGDCARFWIPTELNTPILGQEEAEDGFPNVKQALDTILQCRPRGIHINKWCGLHVHASTREGLSERLIKRVATLTWLLEDKLLFRLCARHRQDFMGSLGSCVRTYADQVGLELPSGHDWRADNIWATQDLPLALAGQESYLAGIWMTSGVMELSDLLAGELNQTLRNGPLALCTSTLADGSLRFQSLEFRHAQSSFSQDFVQNWTGLLITIVKLASLKSALFRGLVRSLWMVTSGPLGETEDCWLRLVETLKTYRISGWSYKIDIEYWVRRVKQNNDSYTIYRPSVKKRVNIYPDIFEDGLARPDSED